MSVLGSGVWPVPSPVPLAQVQASTPLGGQPPCCCLSQVRSREAPCSPLLSLSSFQLCTKAAHAPPQPTAHKSLSPRDLACPFHVPAAGGPPIPPAADSCLSEGPSSMALSGLLAPLSRGCGGHFKGERTALPPSPSPEWGLSQAINTGQPPLCELPCRTGRPPPLPGLGAFFLLALDV